MHRIKGHANTPIYERNENDWYVEPEWCVEALFNKLGFVGSIHDPACGGGTIPMAARRVLGLKSTGADIVDRGYGAVRDFLKDERLYQNIVTNPPYNLAEAFIHHAIRHTEFDVAVLVRLAFLEGQRRKKSLFDKNPPTDIYVLSRRPSMPPGDFEGKAAGGKIAYCWLVWHCAAEDNFTHLDWL